MTTTLYELTITGPPVGKGRPRFTRSGTAYTPGKTVSYENLIRLAFAETYPDVVPSEDPVALQLDAYFPIAQSWTKKKKILASIGLLRMTAKPDLDNIIKAATDALNGSAFADDKQIYRITAAKYYSEKPRLEILLTIGQEEVPRE